MRLLRFNDQDVQLDDKTAIGIDLKKYDIKNPASRYVPVSNQIELLRNDQNMKVIGFAGDAQSLSTIVYTVLKCDYWIGTNHIINNGIAQITEVTETKIKCIISEKGDIWKQLESYTWSEFQEEFIQYLIDSSQIEGFATPYAGTYEDFIDQYIAKTEGVLLPAYIGNLYEEGTETLTEIVLRLDDTIIANGGHFTAYVKDVFKFIENRFNVDFSVDDVSFSYNIFSDPVATKLITPIRNLSINESGSGFYFEYNNTDPFLPSEDLFHDKSEKSLSNFVSSFFQIFNCIIDYEIKLDGNKKYKIRRFDDITNADIIDFSGKFTGKFTFKPSIEGFKQNNYIKYGKIAEGVDKLNGSKYIQCFNKNIEAGTVDESLFNIGAYLPAQFSTAANNLIDLSKAESFEENIFLIPDLTLLQQLDVSCTIDSVPYTTTKSLKLVNVYDIGSEYNTIENMLAYPVYYEVSKWLDSSSIVDLQFFKRYYVKEFGGYFFLNKIAGYNPTESNKATLIEIIKIHD